MIEFNTGYDNAFPTSKTLSHYDRIKNTKQTWPALGTDKLSQ